MGEPVGLVHVLRDLKGGGVQDFTDGWLLVEWVLGVKRSVSVALNVDVRLGELVVERVEVVDAANALCVILQIHQTVLVAQEV